MIENLPLYWEAWVPLIAGLVYLAYFVAVDVNTTRKINSIRGEN